MHDACVLTEEKTSIVGSARLAFVGTHGGGERIEADVLWVCVYCRSCPARWPRESREGVLVAPRVDRSGRCRRKCVGSARRRRVGRRVESSVSSWEVGRRRRAPQGVAADVIAPPVMRLGRAEKRM